MLATSLWLAASAGFSLYVANFGAYSSTYGSLAGVIVFLVQWPAPNVAILFGAQFAAELERTAAAAAEATSWPDSHCSEPGEGRRAGARAGAAGLSAAESDHGRALRPTSCDAAGEKWVVRASD